MTDAQIYDAPPIDQPVGRLARLSHRLVSGSPRWLAPVTVLGCIGGAVGYTMFANPTGTGADSIPSCLVKLTTGLDCPGCGGTRAAWYLLHGDLPAAARHHMIFVFAVPFLLYIYVAWAGRTMFGWTLPRLHLGPKTLAWFLGAWGLFMVLRNLPWAPFTYFFV